VCIGSKNCAQLLPHPMCMQLFVGGRLKYWMPLRLVRLPFGWLAFHAE
jgi:hypothetical protein